jgi:hypothetical protein
MDMSAAGMQADDSTSAADMGSDSAQDNEPTPVTEDTMQPSMPTYDYGSMDASSTDSGDSGDGEVSPAPSMPDVMPITPSAASEEDNADTFEAVPVADQAAADSSSSAGGGMSSADAGGMGAGASTMATESSGAAWATEALRYLDTAQRAMASGDWGGFGQAMNTLRSALESAVSGAAGAAAGAGAQSAPASASTSTSTTSTSDYSQPSPPPTYAANVDSGMSSTAASTDWGASSTSSSTDNGASAPSASGAPSVPSYVSSGTQTPTEQEADEGTMTGMDMGSAGAMSTGAMGAAAAGLDSSPSMGSSAMDMSGTGEAGVARLVVISTGAELSLPEQEEITVGREDPSSGIFPDVDLTPYGGEDGGVSRRHARMLHIGDDYFVEDLQSTNYTKLDGQRLPAHVRERLEDGARLDFGRVAVIFRRS